MGLLAPWFLAGLAAVGIPIYLHLLRRHTMTQHPFSSLMFFEQRTQSSFRHRRLRYLLLLSLRLAVLALLVLAFANPFISRSVTGTGGDKLLLVVIDDSFSMRAGSRLADAKNAAISLLASRAPAVRAQIMTLDSQLHTITQPTQDPGTLRAAVESIAAGDSRGSFGELARGLRSIVESVNTPIELHFFSDIQKSDAPPTFAEMSLPTNVSLVLHPVVKQAVPNWTVESVNAPSQVWDPKKARVEAVVAGYNTPAANRTVSLVVNGKTLATRSVQVSAGGRATASFDSLDVPYGFSRCEVRIDSADALPGDDSSLFSVERSDPQRILFVHEPRDTRSPLYFSAALAAAAESAFAFESVTAGQTANVQPSQYAFVVLSDVESLPSAFQNDLARYIQGGGSVLIAMGTSAAGRAHIPIFDDDVIESRNYSRDPDRFLTVGETDPSYAAIEKAQRWSGVKFYYVVRVDDANAHVIARLTDQTPLLLEKKIGEGRVLLFTSGLDNLTNDFPLHPSFVPFVEQTARYLSGTERRIGSRLVDSFIDLRTAKEQAVGVEVIEPDGRRPLSLKEATTVQSYQLNHAGFYEIRLANGRQDLIAVNPDRRESDLDVIPDDVLALWRGGSGIQGDQASNAADPQEQKKPYSLWWYVMLLVLGAAVAESLLASRYLGAQREDT